MKNKFWLFFAIHWSDKDLGKNTYIYIWKNDPTKDVYEAFFSSLNAC